jgi:large subunit ribosomal protein L4
MAVTTYIDIYDNENPPRSLPIVIVEDSSNYLIHRDILRLQLSQKQGTVSTKTRSEVRGGGKKPWRQKGTGRARAGSNRSPLWRGGGVIFGPKSKTSTLKVNKKERKLAVATLFRNKGTVNKDNADRRVRLVPNLEYITSKTKEFCEYCEKKININVNEKILVIVKKKTLSIKLATQNLKNVELISVEHLNTLSLLKAERILISLEALNVITEVHSEIKSRR